LFSSEGAKIYVVGKVFVEGFEEGLVVLGGVEFFGSEKFCFFVFPCSF
jgi:hypothetical protein